MGAEDKITLDNYPFGGILGVTMERQRITDLMQGLLGVAGNACKRAVPARGEIGGAVNWADLHPCEVEYRLDSHGGEYFCVIVEEAAPDADELKTWLEREIGNEYRTLEPPIRITVETEW